MVYARILTSPLKGDIKSKARLNSRGLATKNVYTCVFIGVVKLRKNLFLSLIVKAQAAKATVLLRTITEMDSGISLVTAVLKYKKPFFVVVFTAGLENFKTSTEYVKFRLSDSWFMMSKISPLNSVAEPDSLIFIICHGGF